MLATIGAGCGETRHFGKPLLETPASANATAAARADVPGTTADDFATPPSAVRNGENAAIIRGGEEGVALTRKGGLGVEAGDRRKGAGRDEGHGGTIVVCREQIPVIATFSILGEWIERVAGEHVRVMSLVGPGGDAHTYEPTPQAAAQVAEARLIFEIGLSFEGWLDKLYQGSGSRGTRHAVTRAIHPRFFGAPGPAAELDPHVWQSPKLAERMVEEVVDALVAADASRADEYRRRGATYRAELRALDLEVRGLLTAVPPHRRVLVTTHDTFGYFAAEYGFEVLSVLESFSSEGGEPSAGELAKVISTIKARRVPAVFAENILDPRTTEQVAKEAGVAVVGTLYTDALGPPDSPGATYAGMMRHNARTIAEALR
jgi:zinc/manganese transport system substrate-binding protein